MAYFNGLNGGAKRPAGRQTAWKLALAAALALASPIDWAGTAAANVSGLPLSFEPNLGQADSDARFYAHGAGYAIALRDSGAELTLGQPAPTSISMQAPPAANTLRLSVEGARHAVQPKPEQALPGRVNYLLGNDRSQWRTNVSTYARVRYAGVYPGVDLVYYGTQGRLEYDFIVAPGAQAAAIGLSLDGADALRLDAHGNLQVGRGDRNVEFLRPVAYQRDGDRHVPVAARYRLAGAHSVRFELGAYDHTQPLIIDPVLSYFSYLGGNKSDVVGSTGPTGGAAGVGNTSVGSQGAAVDAAGNLYVAGYTFSNNFPTHSAAQGSPPSTTPVAFVTKIAPDAKTLVYSTYLGGSDDDFAYGIAVDATGNAFVVGMAGSNDFPIVSGAYQTLCAPNYSSGSALSSCDRGHNGPSNAFVSKLSPSGALLASTFLGGTATGNWAWAVAVDSAGRPYVVGTTNPGENTPAGTSGFTQTVGFPTTAGAVVTSYNWCNGCNVNGNLQTDAFVTVFNSSLSSLVYSTLLGDAQAYAPGNQVGNTLGSGITVDASGNFYIVGATSDGFLPVTTGALQTSIASCGATYPSSTVLNGNCSYVAKFSAVGAGPPTLRYATYLGHMPSCCASQVAAGVAADASGDAYVVGYLNMGGFPTTTGAYQTTCTGCGDAAYIAELNPTGTQLLHSTYFGSFNGSTDNVYQVGPIVIGANGSLYVSGTAGAGLPQVNGLPAAPGGYGGGTPFVAKFDATLATLQFSSLVGTGGSGQVSVDGLAVDAAGNIYLAGNMNGITTSAATAGVFQATPADVGGVGLGDVFVAKIAPTVTTSTALAASGSTALVGANVTFTATVTPGSGSVVPTGTVTFKDGTTTLGTGTLNGTGMALYSTTALAAGAHSVTAVYGGDSGDSASTSTAVIVTVTTPAAPTVTISVAPTSITVGQTATLTWTSTGATACTASGTWTGSQAVSGTLVVTPTAAGSLSYALACTGAGGTGNGTTTLTVAAPAAPTVTISVAPTTITVGQSATITWTSTGATACTASGTWSGSQAVSGTLTLTPAAAGSLSYALACTGAGGTANGTTSLTVNAAATGGSGGGGGGALDLWTLLALSLAALARVCLARRQRVR